MTREEEIRCAALERGHNNYYGFVEGAKWADKTLIDKAVKWLELNFNLPSDFESHFREAMK